MIAESEKRRRSFARLLAPPESRPGQMFLLLAKSWRIVRQGGFRNFARRLWRKCRLGLGIQGSGFLAPFKYQRWLDIREAAQGGNCRSSGSELFSFVLPRLDAPARCIRDTIHSVLAQEYANWELCLPDGGSLSADIQQVLQEFAEESRVRRDSTANANDAIAMARGEFLVLVDPGDTVSPWLSFELARRLHEKPDVDIAYFDEDVVSADGKMRQQPFFKPDWSPELLLSVNFLAHAAVRRSLANSVGLLDCQPDCDYNWDFMFRCSEKARRIEHVPKVLYHCRRGQIRNNHELTASQLRAVEGHCRRIGLAATTVSRSPADAVRVVWPTGNKKVSIIIPTRDKVKLLASCVRSILACTSYKNYEIVLVDNQSRETATLDFYKSLQDDARVRIVDYPAHFNYSTANNLGVRNANGELLLFLNNDTEVLDADWLDELVRWAERPEIGAVGPKLLYANRTVQHAGVILGMESFCGHLYRGVAEDHRDMFGSLNWYRNYQAVTGACLMMRREIFEQIGGFDDGYRLGFGDIDICLRVRKHGYRVLFTPFTRLLHYEGRTRFNHVPVPDLRRAYQEIRSQIEAGDPYFNPNLSYLSCLPMLVEPNEESCRERLRRVMRECGTATETGAAA